MHVTLRESADQPSQLKPLGTAPRAIACSPGSIVSPKSVPHFFLCYSALVTVTNILGEINEKEQESIWITVSVHGHLLGLLESCLFHGGQGAERACFHYQSPSHETY